LIRIGPVTGKKDKQLIRLQAIFLVICAAVFFLTGLPGKYPLRERLIFAVITYIVLLASVFAMVFVTGDKPY